MLGEGSGVIGIVVVSHSRALARAVVDLALQMVPDGKGPRVAIAAGLDEVTLGTDAVAVAEAIASVDSPDGVLVFVDLGSALLSADMALEFVDPAVARRVRVTPAPLVEGLVAAVVTAASSSDIGTVERMALDGLLPKQGHLDDGTPGPTPAPMEAVPISSEFPVLRLTVNAPAPLGLHLRPVSRIAQAMAAFEAEVLIATSSHEPVDAASMLALQTLGAGPGEPLYVSAQGTDAEAALASLRALAQADFGEGEGLLD
jgi:multiphosphoryl transfer protein